VESVFSRLQKGLTKTRNGLVNGVTKVISKNKALDDDVLEQIEEILYSSDVGVETSEKIISELEAKKHKTKINDQKTIIELLQQQLVETLNVPYNPPEPVEPPYVISMVGVNGTGKTTTIGKLAYKYSKEDNSVLLAASDTFRAAAIEQLQIWANRAQVNCVHNVKGSDPASVAYDALVAAKSRQKDILIIDTAGRLHTKKNLMSELGKIHRVINKSHPGAPHEVLLVIDATTGQNGLYQARQFTQDIGVTGIIVTKLDGTAKGGIVFAIATELKIPIRYVGFGEKIDDLEKFDAKLFVEALFR
jgi:fused signal recognition particle receptor